jgi:hypothetical protein
MTKKFCVCKIDIEYNNTAVAALFIMYIKEFEVLQKINDSINLGEISSTSDVYVSTQNIKIVSKRISDIEFILNRGGKVGSNPLFNSFNSEQSYGIDVIDTLKMIVKYKDKRFSIIHSSVAREIIMKKIIKNKYVFKGNTNYDILLIDNDNKQYTFIDFDENSDLNNEEHLISIFEKLNN